MIILEIKLIASDLDGTLLTSEKVLTERLKTALINATEKGIYFVPATGRVLDAVPDFIKALPNRYIITSNGAKIYDPINKKDVYKRFLSSDDARFVIDSVRHLPVIIEIFSDNKAFIDKKAFDNLSFYNLSETHFGYISKTRLPVDIYELLDKNCDSLENINIIFKNPTDRADVFSMLKNEKRFSVTSSSPINIEITDKKATKGEALKALCGILSLKKENIMAFGDSENDLSMIEFAGCGVAMGNAEEKIKSKADIVAKSCDSFGVSSIIEKLLEGEI